VLSAYTRAIATFRLTTSAQPTSALTTRPLICAAPLADALAVVCAARGLAGS
jgi:hypothetical protein